MKRKLMYLFLSCLLISFTASGAFAVVYGEGGYEAEGYSESTAWEINSAKVLEKYRNNANDGELDFEHYVKLTKDIENCKFDGTITLSGQNGNAPDVYAGGIVGYAGWSYHIFSIKNCKVGSTSNTSIKASTTEGARCCYSGGLIGHLYDTTFDRQPSTVSGNYVRATVTGGQSGGIYGGREGGTGVVENNTYVDPTDDPEPEYDDVDIDVNYSKNATVNKLYTATARASEGKAPYTWTLSGTADWLELDSNKGETVTLSGKPTKTGTFTAELKVEDANGDTETESFKIKVVSAPKISGTFNGATLETSYNGSAKISGGTAPYTVTKSGVPAGMTYEFSGNTVKLSGKPTKAKTYSFKITAKDSNGAKVSKTFKIVVAKKPTISGTFNAGKVGTSYSGSAKVTNGTAPYTWSKSNVPTGLTYKASGDTVKLSGKPTKAGTYSFKITAKDANGAKVSKTFSIKISAASKLTFTKTLPEGTVGEAYNGNVKVSGGTSPYTWTKSSGTVPNGLKLSANTSGTTLKITKTPTKTGDYTFKMKVVDAKGVSSTVTCAISISDPEEEEIDIDFSQAPRDSESENQVFSSHEIPTTDLKVFSEDILWQGEGRDEDLIEVRENQPVRFIIGEWKFANGSRAEISAEDVEIFVDDKFVEGIDVLDEGKFELPSEYVHGDFKVQAKAEELETVELFISAKE